MERQDVVRKTWEKLGVEGCRPASKSILVVCDAPPTKIGSIYVSPRHSRFYGPLEPTMIRATVLSTGDEVHGIAPGDRVLFSRTFFCRWQEIEPEVMVGWVSWTNVVGQILDEDEPEAVTCAVDGPSMLPTNPPSDLPVQGVAGFRAQMTR